jgi:hypothetical protein
MPRPCFIDSRKVMMRFLLIIGLILAITPACGYRLGMPQRTDLAGVRTLMFPTCRDGDARMSWRRF